MRNKTEKIIILFIMLLANIAGAVEDSNALVNIVQPTDILTSAQRLWLKEHPDIKIGMDPAYEPLVIKQADGSVTGVYIEILNELNRVLRTDIEIVYGSWSEMVHKARTRETAGLLTAAPVQCQLSGLLGTKTIHYEFPMVYVHYDSPLELVSLSDLKGLRIALQKDVECLAVLVRPYDQYAAVYETNTSLEAFKLLSEGKIDAVVAQNYEEYMLSKYMMAGARVAFTDIENPTPISIAIRNDWPELVAIIDRGLDEIGREKIMQHYNRWLSPYRAVFAMELTSAEKVWLTEHPSLRVGLANIGIPYVFTDDSGQLQGLYVDYLAVFSRLLERDIIPVLIEGPDAKSEMQKAGLDMVLTCNSISEEDGLLICDPFYKSTHVIVNRTNEPYVNDMNWLNDKVVVVLEKCDTAGHMTDISSAKTIKTNDILSGLKLVSQGLADAFIGDAVSVSYVIVKGNLPDLKVAAATNYTEDMGYLATASTDAELHSIINKAVFAITSQDHERIKDKWMAVRYDQVANWRQVWQLVSIIAAIPLGGLVLLVFWNRQLNRAVESQTRELAREKRFTDLISESLQDTLIVYDPSISRAIRWNKSLVELSGYNDDELARMKMPDELYSYKDTLIAVDAVQKAIEQGQSSCAIELITKAGKKIATEYRLSRMDNENGTILYLVVVGRDITQRKEYERELEEYRDHLEVLVRNRTDELNARNQDLEEAMDLLKQTQGQLILYEKLGALRHLVSGIAHEINSPLGVINSSRETLTHNIRRIVEHIPEIADWLRGQHGQIVRELITRCFTNKKRIVLSSSREKRQERDRIMAELKKLGLSDSQELARYMFELQLSDRLPDYLPVLQENNALKLFTHIAAIVDAFVACDTIEVAVQRASKITFALNNYIRRGAKGHDGLSTRELVSIKESLDNVLTLFYNAIKHSVVLDLDLQDDLPMIEAYPDELNQVWTNLIKNAIDAMEQKGTLGIKACYENDGIMVEVSDTGCGMTPEVQKRLFEPLFTTKPAGEGLGLGMDIVRRIVIDNHSGKIAVDSTPGAGTT
ncbi:MAG: transporter substrate-binding domain-containing protein, partial [Sedimentisphaerales bacterium]|nr:transporter substrate-binding domain-containing protein [Sedimentisphaerales bacterium]